MSALIELAERRVVRRPLIRGGIRYLVRSRLGSLSDSASQEMLVELGESPIALHTDAANEQHYEVPAPFYELVLGSHLKYSSGYWAPHCDGLDQAEADMLSLYCERARLKDGQNVLDLGCGWGSFTLFAAARFPGSRFTAVSNSTGQREFIEARARERGLDNIRVITADVNHLELDDTFDRIVSVEMFEHVRNYAALLRRISSWLNDDGYLFVHIFCHREHVYPYETEGDGNWMDKYFFTGGLMPAIDTLLHFQDEVELDKRWIVNGTHYAKTARAWLDNLDRDRAAVRRALEPTYGTDVDRWVQRWSMFFMACEELFGYRNGEEWMVSHYRFAKRS